MLINVGRTYALADGGGKRSGQRNSRSYMEIMHGSLYDQGHRLTIICGSNNVKKSRKQINLIMVGKETEYMVITIPD